MDKISLLKAICFYNYSETDEEDVKSFEPQQIFKFLGAQARFEIYDYYLLVRFLSCDLQKLVDFFNERSVNSLDR